MPLYPRGKKLDEFPGRFLLCNLAAKRASQLLKEQAPILVETDSEHPLTVALEEIADGAITYVRVEEPKKPIPQPTLQSLETLGEGLDVDLLSQARGIPESVSPESSGPEALLRDLLQSTFVDEPVTDFKGAEGFAVVEEPSGNGKTESDTSAKHELTLADLVEQESEEEEEEEES
jgi:DNA-directed RNA polymerase omega subunit